MQGIIGGLVTFNLAGCAASRRARSGGSTHTRGDLGAWTDSRRGAALAVKAAKGPLLAERERFRCSFTEKSNTGSASPFMYAAAVIGTKLLRMHKQASGGNNVACMIIMYRMD